MRVLRLLARHVDIGLLWHIRLAECFEQEGLRLVLRELRDARGIGSHVGDETGRTVASELDALIELLGEHHRLARGEAELARGVLLQGARRERSRRAALALAAAHRLDDELLLHDVLCDGHRLALVVQGDLLAVFIRDGKPLAIDLHEVGLEHCRLRLAQLESDGPVLVRLEGLDLLLAVADQAHRHRLDAASREALAHLAPEERRQLVTDDAVEHAARLLRVYLIEVDRARVLDRLLDGRLRDFVEDDAAVRRRVEPQDECQMPGNGLSLTIGIACEIDLVGIFRVLLERLDELALAAYVDVFRCEVVLDVDAELTLRQVAQMPHGGAHHVLSSQIFLDGLGLGRRLDNDERSLCLRLGSCLCFCCRTCFCCSQTVTPSRHACRRAVHFL